jgi:hypothetical protein
VFGVFGAVAGDVEGGEAGGVFGELVLWGLLDLLGLVPSSSSSSSLALYGIGVGHGLTPQRSWLGEFCAIQYVFMYSRRS